MFIRVVQRKAWGARPPKSRVPAIWTKDTTVRVHHSVSNPPLGKRYSPKLRAAEREHMQQLQRFHMEQRGYADIGYNYLIFPSGNVYEGRGKRVLGAHTLGHNADCGICFVGNYEVDKPTPEAISSFKQLRRRLGLRGRIVAHSRTFPTSCPGDNIRKALNLRS